MLKEQVLGTELSARNIGRDGKALLEELPQTTQLKNAIYLYHQKVGESQMHLSWDIILSFSVPEQKQEQKCYIQCYIK